jgi:hypothetical protein
VLCKWKQSPDKQNSVPKITQHLSNKSNIQTPGGLQPEIVTLTVRLGCPLLQGLCAGPLWPALIRYPHSRENSGQNQKTWEPILHDADEFCNTESHLTPLRPCLFLSKLRLITAALQVTSITWNLQKCGVPFWKVNSSYTRNAA